MSRALTQAALQAIFSQDTNDAFHSLITIDHPDLVSPIRTINDSADLNRIDTFSRASVGTYRDEDGLLATAAVDELRPDYDSSLAFQGSLIESAGTNVLNRSEELDDAAWSTARLSVSADVANGPDGTQIADGLVANTDNNTHPLFQSFTSSVGEFKCASVFAKRGVVNAVRLWLNGAPFPGNPYIDVDLRDGTLIGSNGTITYGIDPWLNGWYRIHVTAEVTSSGTPSYEVYPREVGSLAFAGDASSVSIYAFGAQCEDVADINGVPSSYIKSEGSSGLRSADVATLNNYLAFPYRLDWPSDEEGAPPRARLTIDNVSRDIGDALQSISSPPSIEIKLVRYLWPDITETTLPVFNLRDVKVDSLIVQGNLVLDDDTAEPFPADTFVPSNAPGVFA